MQSRLTFWVSALLAINAAAGCTTGLTSTAELAAPAVPEAPARCRVVHGWAELPEGVKGRLGVAWQRLERIATRLSR